MEVSGLVSLGELDITDTYDSIEDELKDKWKENNIDQSFNLRDLIQQVKRLSYRYEPDRVTKPMIDMMNKPDNKFGISVIAKILEAEGLKTNKSISTMAERYEKNLEEFIDFMYGKDLEKEFKDVVDNEEKVEPATEKEDKKSKILEDYEKATEESSESIIEKDEIKEEIEPSIFNDNPGLAEFESGITEKEEPIESVKEDTSPDEDARS